MPATMTDHPADLLNEAETALQHAQERARDAAAALERARAEFAAQDAALDAGDRTITPSDIRQVANRLRAAEADDQTASRSLAGAEAEHAEAKASAEVTTLASHLSSLRNELTAETQAVRARYGDYCRQADKLAGLVRLPDQPIHPVAARTRQLRDEADSRAAKLRAEVERFNRAVAKLRARAAAAHVPWPAVRDMEQLDDLDRVALSLAQGALAKAEGTDTHAVADAALSAGMRRPSFDGVAGGLVGIG